MSGCNENNFIFLNYNTEVYWGRAWSKYQQTLMTEIYRTGFLSFKNQEVCLSINDVTFLEQNTNPSNEVHVMWLWTMQCHLSCPSSLSTFTSASYTSWIVCKKIHPHGMAMLYAFCLEVGSHDAAWEECNWHQRQKPCVNSCTDKCLPTFLEALHNPFH